MSTMRFRISVAEAHVVGWLAQPKQRRRRVLKFYVPRPVTMELRADR